MTFMFNGLTAEVTISGGLTIAKQTTAWASGSKSGAGNTVIGTVPAGKKWSIISAQLTSYNNNVTLTASLQLNAVTTLCVVTSSAGAQPVCDTAALSWDYSACPVLTAGQTAIVLNDVAGGLSAGCIVYVEEAA